VKDYLSEVQNM